MITAAALNVGMDLSPLDIKITRKMIIMGATASRDWQPQHHDKQWAVAAGLPDIIMNNYTQSGLISRFITDWSGPMGRIGRVRFKMHRPIVPELDLHIAGKIVDLVPDFGGKTWVTIDVSLLAEDLRLTSSTVKLAVQSRIESQSPWHCAPTHWKP